MPLGHAHLQYTAEYPSKSGNHKNATSVKKNRVHRHVTYINVQVRYASPEGSTG